MSFCTRRAGPLCSWARRRRRVDTRGKGDGAGGFHEGAVEGEGGGAVAGAVGGDEAVACEVHGCCESGPCRWV